MGIPSKEAVFDSKEPLNQLYRMVVGYIFACVFFLLVFVFDVTD